MDFSVIEENLHLKIQSLNRERNTNFTYLKPLQSVCIMQTYERDVISALKIGYGKSLIRCKEIVEYYFLHKMLWMAQYKFNISCPKTFHRTGQDTLVGAFVI
jgi:hypothetical protein